MRIAGAGGSALVDQLPDDPDAAWSLFDDSGTGCKSKTSCDAAVHRVGASQLSGGLREEEVDKDDVTKYQWRSENRRQPDLRVGKATARVGQF